MDANGTPFEMLLGRHDWARCLDAETGEPLGVRWFASPPASDLPELAWDPNRHELTLRPELQRFVASRSDRPVSLEDRRGAACDSQGNWYWIDPGRHQVLVRNAGDGTVRPYWPDPAARPDDAPESGAFRPVTPPSPCPVLNLSGLTVTHDHQLVVGLVDPGGFLIFDLQGGGAPRRIEWPGTLLTPFDLAARPRGGFFLLDRSRRRLWEFDRAFQCVSRAPNQGAVDVTPDFTPLDPGGAAPSRSPCNPRPQLADADAVPLNLEDPVALDSLPDGSVLILDRRPAESFPLLAHYRHGQRLPDPVGLEEILAFVRDEDQSGFRIEAHDFVFLATSAGATDEEGYTALGAIYLATQEGNQAYAFNLSEKGDPLRLKPQVDFLPMRRFGGRALAVCDGRVFYDSTAAWVPLVGQIRPRYVLEGVLITPAFDGRTPDCTWHRLFFDACLPPEAIVEVWSRAGNDTDSLSHLDWNREPMPLRRPLGSELPWPDPPLGSDRGTWETLFQRARGRFLQVQLRLAGNGRVSPRVRALRIYAPRFSYLRRYLPPVYREDETSASFLERLLANFEGQWTALEDRIATAQVLFDARTAPRETLDWLADWYGVALDPAWDDARRRLFLRHAMTFFAYRGTLHGLNLALRLMFDAQPDERLFTHPIAPRGRQSRFRIVERFRQRRPLPLPGSGSGSSSLWTPDQGAVLLHQRWRTFAGLAEPTARFPVRRPADQAATWTAFTRVTLGFVPRAAESDLEAWRSFLEQRYVEIELLKLAHEVEYPGFSSVPLPVTLPAEGALREDWDLFKLEVRGPDAATQELLWQDFLRRRHRQLSELREIYGPTVAEFADVPLPVELPGDSRALRDWYEFEGVILPMHETAHRFMVLIPLTTTEMRQSSTRQREQLSLADRLIRLEKPAHTVYDVRLFWAAFRIGSARLGDDTLLGSSSRAAELAPPLELGAGYLAEAHLTARPPRGTTNRLAVGQHRLRRSPRQPLIPRNPL